MIEYLDHDIYDSRVSARCFVDAVLLSAAWINPHTFNAIIVSLSWTRSFFNGVSA